MQETQVKFLAGFAFLFVGWAMGNAGHGSLGDFGAEGDPVVPRKRGVRRVPASEMTRQERRTARAARRAEYIRTHIAKKYWGAAVVGEQEADSLVRLARRTKEFDPAMAESAMNLSARFSTLGQEAAALARQNDAPWVENRVASYARSAPV